MSEGADLRVLEENPEEAISEQGEQVPQRRERSTIAFPYDDLDAALSVAQSVLHHHGGHATTAQVAASLGQTTRSGAFRVKTSAARLFGLVTVGRDAVDLTEAGQRILDSQSEAQARANAFLNVPLYKALYERFKDGALPDDAGLEAAIRDLGVTTKQVQTARQVFQRSAQQAGFFRFGNRKLVLPSMTTVVSQQEQPEASHETDEGGVEGSSMENLVKHPFILGLLRELPELDAEFSADDRSTWLDAAKISFDLIYGKVQPRNFDDRHQGA